MLELLSIALIVFTLPGIFELLFLTVGALLPKGRSSLYPICTSIGNDRTVIVIPAHDESMTIERTVRSVTGGKQHADIVVIADNCVDDTAEKAVDAGARVIERTEPEKRGKNYALEFAFKKLMGEGYSRFVVIDADSLVQSNLIEEISRVFDQGCHAVQIRNGVLHPYVSYRARLMNIGFDAFNLLRPLGRQRWGFSAGLLGTGMAFSREALLAVPYQVDSIVEDLAYHLRLVEAGISVHFTDKTAVKTELPTTQAAAENQRARWEGGRVRVAYENIPLLFKQLFLGKWRTIEPLLDLMLMPLAYLCITLLVLLMIGGHVAQTYVLIAYSVIIVHILTAIKIGGGGLKDVVALFLAPVYLLWKLKIVFRIFQAAEKGHQWVRTDRNKII